MKKINLLFVLMLITIIFSCNEDESFSKEITEGKSSKINTLCTISPSASCGSPGENLNLTYNSEFDLSNTEWEVTSGNLSILNGQGTNKITLQLDSEFNGGSVNALGSGQEICSETYIISKCNTIDCDLSLGGELTNGNLIAFSPRQNKVSSNILYKTDMWVSPSNDVTVSWTKVSASTVSLSWYKSGLNLSFRFNNRNPTRETGATATFRMTISKNGCESLSRDFTFCYGDCGAGGGTGTPSI